MSTARVIKAQLERSHQGHIRLAGRTPSGIGEVQMAFAERDFARRTALLKAIAPKLAQLDAFVPALEERGISLACRTFDSWDGGKTIRLQENIFSKDNQLLDALLALGFKEMERKDSFRDEQQVTVKHGRALLLTLTVRKPAADAGAPS